MIQPPDYTPLDHQIDLDAELLSDLENTAIAAAERAGAYVAGKFGGVLAVEEKNDAGRSLVTDADRESQRIVAEVIAERYPDHELLGEEDPPDQDPAAPDFVWAVDPIDGTTNFVNALPTYVVSIAALYRGSPVAAALYLPWPNEGGHVIFHARTDGGAWMGSERVYVKGPLSGSMPQHGRVTMVPIEDPSEIALLKSPQDTLATLTGGPVELLDRKRDAGARCDRLVYRGLEEKIELRGSPAHPLVIDTPQLAAGGEVFWIRPGEGGFLGPGWLDASRGDASATSPRPARRFASFSPRFGASWRPAPPRSTI